MFTLVVYILYDGYAVKIDNPLKLSDVAAFNGEQSITICFAYDST